MKAYKGLIKHDDGTLWCRDMQYEVGKTYTYDGKIKLCKSGFHACHELYQVWQFYPNNGNIVFYEVECGDVVIESNEGDGKIVCSEITLLKEVDMTGAANFDYGCSFREGYARVLNDWKWNYINTEGKLLTEKWLDDAWSFFEGFACVKKDGKYNFINTEGKLLTEEWWDDASDFNEGFACVKKGGKYNYINREGKLLTETWWDYAYNFNEDYAKVKKDRKWHKINKEGKLINVLKKHFKNHKK